MELVFEEHFPTPEEAKRWVHLGLNVLIIGETGGGKSALTTAAAKNSGLYHRYFMSSTMDIWNDMIGIPRPKIDPESKVEHLDFLMPKDFAEDKVGMLIFDELGRAPPKVMNSLMEVILNRSINGKPMSIKSVWACMNPHTDDGGEGDYQVVKLDAAQLERFDIRIRLPYRLYMPYFIEKYGRTLALAMESWWNGLSDQVKKSVSPRRLDQAMYAVRNGVPVELVLPSMCNRSSFVDAMNLDSFTEVFEKLNKKPKNEVLLQRAGTAPSPVLASLFCNEELPEARRAMLSRTAPDMLSAVLQQNPPALVPVARMMATSKLKKSMLQTFNALEMPARIGIETIMLKAKKKSADAAAFIKRVRDAAVDAHNELTKSSVVRSDFDNVYMNYFNAKNLTRLLKTNPNAYVSGVPADTVERIIKYNDSKVEDHEIGDVKKALDAIWKEALVNLNNYDSRLTSVGAGMGVLLPKLGDDQSTHTNFVAKVDGPVIDVQMYQYASINSLYLYSWAVPDYRRTLHHFMLESIQMILDSDAVQYAALAIEEYGLELEALFSVLGIGATIPDTPTAMHHLTLKALAVHHTGYRKVYLLQEKLAQALLAKLEETKQSVGHPVYKIIQHFAPV